jgi:parallel beta-helix repeat protein
MKTIIKAIWCILVLAVSASAADYTVKAGGGGNYSTIQACATAMSAGDTCTVFAGTYNERVTLSAGSAGNYKTITVNGSDVVTVQGFSIASYSKIIGNCPALQGTVTTATCGFFITNPSSPSTSCFSWGSSTDFYIVGNVAYACGTWGGNATESSHPTHGFIQGNTYSYPGGTVASPNAGPGISLHGDYFLVENNDISHTSDGFHFSGSYNVIRHNTFHDNLAAECGSNSGNCHIDFIESEPNVSGGDVYTRYNMYEGNTEINNLGANGHGFLIQADVCNGECVDTIIRFNIFNHVGSAGVENDNKWAGVPSYNNTLVDVGSGGGGGITDSCSNGATDCQYFNNLYYYPGSVSDWNAIGVSGGTLSGASHHLAYCGGSCSGLHGFNYGSGSWLSGCATCLLTNPLFVGTYDSSGAFDLHLQSGSPASGAGTYLTTASESGSSTTSLVIADDIFFQDNPGGISGVQPDTIRIGSSTVVQIAQGGINRSTHALTLASAVSWNNGDPIYLYKDSGGNVVLNGANPDIGAMVDSTSASAPAPPTGLTAVVN